MSSFSWDRNKEILNIKKHGVDFETAERAFKDPDRKIFRDVAHSCDEERYYCIGKVEGHILTIRFTYREDQNLWCWIVAKGEAVNMKKGKSDLDMPSGKLVRVADFLPPPDKIVLSEETVKVTIALKKSSVEFFKKQALKQHAKYQKMIRELLDQYASHYKAA